MVKTVRGGADQPSVQGGWSRRRAPEAGVELVVQFGQQGLAAARTDAGQWIEGLRVLSTAELAGPIVPAWRAESSVPVYGSGREALVTERFGIASVAGGRADW